MLDSKAALDYYKRRDIQEVMVKAARNREIAARYGEGFGKRPDVLQFGGDIYDLAKQGATSFHCSEELWNNPLSVVTGMRQAELDSLRQGWDLVLDIDCPSWNFSRIIGWLIVNSLKEHGIKSISAKFSGNKGFHIAVPYEAFPKTINGKETKNLFPEAARIIAEYLLDYISNKHVEVRGEKIIFGKKFVIDFKKLNESIDKPLVQNFCAACGSKIKDIKKLQIQFICPICEHTENSDEEIDYKQCPKCKKFMERLLIEGGPVCKCGSRKYKQKFNPLAIIEVDTILIASRHLFRMPYSLHEKSGLSSIPINPDKILNFEKEMADPQKIKGKLLEFIPKEKVSEGEANLLFTNAYEFYFNKKTKEEKMEGSKKTDFEEIKDAVPEEIFPPCIKLGLKGLKDGKKRFMFALINFLAVSGWSHDKIEARLIEWNKNNPEPLREHYIIGQLRYTKVKKEKVLPPNCRSFYQDLGICQPENLCEKIKNPASYSRRKAFALRSNAKPARKKRKN